MAALLISCAASYVAVVTAPNRATILATHHPLSTDARIKDQDIHRSAAKFTNPQSLVTYRPRMTCKALSIRSKTLMDLCGRLLKLPSTQIQLHDLHHHRLG